MSYRPAFFLVEIVTLVTIGMESVDRTKAFMEAYAQLGGLFCPAYTTGPPVLGLLFGLNVVLLMIYRWPRSEFLWWLHLTGILCLLMTLPPDYSPSCSLLLISVGLGLAYRQELNSTAIWGWKGCLVIITAGIAATWLYAFWLSQIRWEVI